jgi:dUTP pyrophosphatase
MFQLENDPNWQEIQEQFKKLVEESGVNLDEFDYDAIEDEFGLSKDDLQELERETVRNMTSHRIYFKKVHPDAVTPEYAYPSDSGFDLYSVEDITIPALGRALVPTGICVELTENLEIQVRPKSGLALNQGITVLNTPGTVDSGYNGEIKVILFNTNNGMVQIKKGMKIAQACVCPVLNGKYVIIEEADELGVKDRGSNGFGSTGLGSIK